MRRSAPQSSSVVSSSADDGPGHAEKDPVGTLDRHGTERSRIGIGDPLVVRADGHAIAIHTTDPLDQPEVPTGGVGKHPQLADLDRTVTPGEQTLPRLEGWLHRPVSHDECPDSTF